MDAPVSAKAALLQELSRAPGHGLALIERVRAASGGLLELGQGSVYPALRELEREGFAKVDVETETGRMRWRYRITARGKKKAAEQRAAVAGVFGLKEAMSR